MPSRCFSVNTCDKKIDMKKGPNLRWSLIQCSGGDEGDRTPDLLTASQALSQLSYAPVRKSTIRELGRRCKDIFRKTFAGGDAAAPAPRAGPIVLPGPPVLPGPTRRQFGLARGPPPGIGAPARCRPHYRCRPRGAPPRRPKRRPVYYDDSGMADHAAVFANVASALPAVLQTEDEACSRTVDPS